MLQEHDIPHAMDQLAGISQKCFVVTSLLKLGDQHKVRFLLKSSIILHSFASVRCDDY
jgi:hypothetical protein